MALDHKILVRIHELRKDIDTLKLRVQSLENKK